MKELEQLPIPLLLWYRENARVLPWRSLPTPYRVWISEIMLQQTRVAAVLDYFTRFMDELPTVEDLAAADEEKLLKLWQGLGYYNRARNLQKAARQVLSEFGGVFPDTYEKIRRLCGVGDYTAGAIASIAFGIPVPAVDGNVLRVVSRITGDSSDITSPARKEEVAATLVKIMPARDPGDFNQALMELGATVCLPNGAPDCARCPASGFCAAYLTGRTGELPVKAPKKARKKETRTVFLIFHGKKAALRRRPEKGLLAGLWEFPNEPAGKPEQILEAWGITPLFMEHGGTGKHIFTHIEWHMDAVVVETAADTLPPGWVWADRAALHSRYAVPNAFHSFEHIVGERL
ncbi:MAG: A/G-specific adenine glycosylase [Oscillospiraceae bacterium]|nr:A/G-specific adenine glycosylase [Oscillospiraceae bacterium]